MRYRPGIAVFISALALALPVAAQQIDPAATLTEIKPATPIDPAYLPARDRERTDAASLTRFFAWLKDAMDKSESDRVLDKKPVYQLDPSTMKDSSGEIVFIGELPVAEPLREAATAWWSVEKPDVPLPLSAYFLLTSIYRTPVVVPRSGANATSVEPGPSATLASSVNKQEVDSQEAAGAIVDVVPASAANANAVSMALSRSSDEIESCSSAVKEIRKSITDFGVSGNRLDHFDDLCLFARGSVHPPKLETRQRAAALSCSKAYDDYVQNCFDDTQYTDLIEHNLGILFEGVRGHIEDSVMLCTAYRTSESKILASRHCIDGFLQRGTGPKYELFFEDFHSGAVRRDVYLAQWSKGSPLAQQVTSEVRFGTDGDQKVGENSGLTPKRGCTVQELFVGGGSSGIVSAMRDSPVAGTKTSDTLEVGDRLQLTAINQIVLRLHRLEARLNDEGLPSDADFLATGNWRQLIRTDGSSTCRVAAIKPDGSGGKVFGHYCQSWPMGSGAPVFRIPEADAAKPNLSDKDIDLVGIHVGTDGGNCVSMKPRANIGAGLEPWVERNFIAPK